MEHQILSKEEEVETLRDTLMTFRDVVRVALCSEVRGCGEFGDDEDDYILELFFEDGSSLLTYIQTTYKPGAFGQNLSAIERYVQLR